MDIELAITTALTYENRVVKVYEEAAAATPDPAGKKMFEVLVRDEQSHVKYLESKLEEWKQSGHVTASRLETLIPSVDRIEAGIKTLKSRVATTVSRERAPSSPPGPPGRARNRGLLQIRRQRAPRRGQASLPEVRRDRGRAREIVQAEIDSVSGLGFWFDIQEFDLPPAEGFRIAQSSPGNPPPAWRNYLIFAPASWATAASVVWAALRPRRKSLSLKVAEHVRGLVPRADPSRCRPASRAPFRAG